MGISILRIECYDLPVLTLRVCGRPSLLKDRSQSQVRSWVLRVEVYGSFKLLEGISQVSLFQARFAQDLLSFLEFRRQSDCRLEPLDGCRQFAFSTKPDACIQFGGCY